MVVAVEDFKVYSLMNKRLQYNMSRAVTDRGVSKMLQEHGTDSLGGGRLRGQTVCGE